MTKKLPQKEYYCPHCQKYPTKMIERYHSVDELREWDEEMQSWELISSTLEDPESIHCADCDSELIDKELNP